MGISISSAVPTAVHNPGGATSFGSYLTAAGGVIDPYNAAYTSGNSSGTAQCYPITQCIAAGGEGGFDGFTAKGAASSLYGTVASLTVSGQHSGLGGKYGQPGNGYGAGGGAMLPPLPADASTTYYQYPCYYTPASGTDNVGVPAVALGGCAGSIEMTIADIVGGESIACTVGLGGGTDLTDVCAATKSYIETTLPSLLKSFEFYKLHPKQPAAQRMLTAGKDGVIILEYLGG